MLDSFGVSWSTQLFLSISFPFGECHQWIEANFIGSWSCDRSQRIWKYVFKEAIHVIYLRRNNLLFAKYGRDISADYLIRQIVDRVEDLKRLHVL